MVRRGTHEHVARRISGYLSEVFSRYDIISDKDLEMASDEIGAELGQTGQ